jgi:hypothetical protein
VFNEVSDEIMPIVRHPLAKSQNYNKTQEEAMKFPNAYSISDKLKTEIFEGTRDRYYFTPLQWYNCRLTSKWVLLLPSLDSSRQMSMYKLMFYPLQDMQARVSSILASGHDSRDERRYV